MNADHQAVVERTILYCWLIDERDFDRLDEVFVRTARAKLGATRQNGLEEIRAKCQAALGPLDASHHMVSNHEVTVDVDSAAVRCYMRAQHVLKGCEGGDLFEVGGMYLDTFQRTQDGWRIADRVLEVTWSTGNPAVIGR